jgi:hypothetical protein
MTVATSHTSMALLVGHRMHDHSQHNHHGGISKQTMLPRYHRHNTS